MPVAGQRRNLLNGHVLHAEHRLRIFHAVRLEYAQRFDVLLRQPLRLHHAVDVQLRNELRHGDMRFRVLAQARAEFFDPVRLHGQSCGKRMTAVALEQVLTRGKRLKQIEAADRAAGALAYAVLVHRDEHDRTAVAVAQARAHNADNALMPAFSGQHDNFILKRVVFAAQACERLLEYLVLLALAQLVLLAKLGGKRLCAYRIFRQEQLCCQLGLAHAARRVDARRKHIADGRGGQAPVLHPRLTQQHFQTDIRRHGQLFQSFRHDNAVFTDNRHDIGYRAERYKVGVPVEHGKRVALECADQLECHTDTRKTGKRIGIVRPLAVHDRLRVRQVFVALVVVGNDDLHAELACDVNLLVGCNARVHRDEQARALLIQLLHRRTGQTVAVRQTIGNVIFTFCALAAQIIHQCARCRDAVHVVITVDHHFLSAIHYLTDDLDCLIHIGQTERIMQSAHIAAQVIRRSLRCVDAARRQHRRRQRCIAGLPRQHPHPLGVRRGDHPSLCSHIERSLPESRQQHAFRRLRMVTPILYYHYYTKTRPKSQHF